MSKICQFPIFPYHPNSSQTSQDRRILEMQNILQLRSPPAPGGQEVRKRYETSSLQNVRVFVLGGVLPAANLVTLVTIKQPAFLDCIYFFVFSIGSKLQKGVRCASIKNMSEDGGLISFQQIPVCLVDTKLVHHSCVVCWTCWTHTGVSDLHLSVVSPSRYLGSSWLKIPSVRRGTPKLESFRRVFPFLDHFCWRFSHFQIVQIGRDWQVHQVVCQGRQRFFSWFLMFLKGLAFAKLHQIIKTARGVCWKRNHL